MITTANAYAHFRRNPDLANWQNCLAAGSDVVHETLVMAIYARWMSWLCGQDNVAREITTTLRQLSATAFVQLEAMEPAAAILTRGVIAAGCGYSATAADILTAYPHTLPVELATLTTPSDPAMQAAVLREYVSDPDRRPNPNRNPFLPAIYFYGHALLDLGYLQELQRVLKDHEAYANHALLTDLQGKLHELDGSWEEAADCYRQSAWDQHAYRAAICGMINSGSAEIDVTDAISVERLRRGMFQFSSEVDQIEVARSMAFVNACRWNQFDNWLVNFELGKLSFQRRRHAEADKQLQRAAEQAPEPFQFTVNQLRFVNLTWIAEGDGVRDLPMQPETLECAYRALHSEGNEREKAGIRLHLATVTGEQSYLQPIFETALWYEIGDAYTLQNKPTAALHSWVIGIGDDYRPRIFQNLIRRMVTYRFTTTAMLLIDVVLRESWYNFFELWELGLSLLNQLRGWESSYEVTSQLGRKLEQIDTRLQELSQFDFQHLIRAFNFYRDYGRQDVAGELLRRASRLAESAEEHLNIAVARRSSAWFRASEGNVLGEDSLGMADRSARDRLDRLQIAREYSRYGQFHRARQILRELDILTATDTLNRAVAMRPIEAIILLQCGYPCLEEKTIKEILVAANATLDQAWDAGRFSQYADEFYRRLAKFQRFDDLDPIEAPQKEATEEESVVAEDLANNDSTEDERSQLDSKWAYYEQWNQLRGNFEAELENAYEQQLIVTPNEVPISKHNAIVPGDRSQQLAKLWKHYFQASTEDEDEDIHEEKDAVMAQIRLFEAEETALIHRWEQRHAVEMADSLKTAQESGGAATVVLQQIVDWERHSPAWPPFLGIATALEDDRRRLTEQITQRLNGAV